MSNTKWGMVALLGAALLAVVVLGGRSGDTEFQTQPQPRVQRAGPGPDTSQLVSISPPQSRERHRLNAELPSGDAAEAAAGPRDNAGLLPPPARLKTLRVAAPGVLSCIAESRVDLTELDPRMHGRLHVASDAQGKSRVVAVEVVGGETAPKPFLDCVDRVLKRLELDLEPGTTGLVVTPPFAGER